MNLSIRNMLIGVVALMITLVAGGGILSLTSLGSVQKNIVNMATNWVPSVNLVNAINTDTSDLRIAEAAHIMSTTPEEMSKAEADFNAAMADMKKNQATYEPLISSDGERQTYNAFKDKLAIYMGFHEKLFALSRANQNVEAAELFKGEMKTVYDDFSNSLDKDVQINVEGANTDYKSSTKQYGVVQLTTLGVLGVSLLAGFGAVIVIFNGVIKPIRRTTDVMATISKGRLDAEIPYGMVQNEIGDMARTLAVFRDGLAEAETLRVQAARQKEQAEAARRTATLELADNFEKSVGGIVTMVSSAASEMQAAAAQLSATAQEASAQSVAVSAAAEQAGANVSSVAASAEELGASVSEIGRQLETSTSITQGAVREADTAAAIVGELNEVASTIGGVIDMIAGLASQTWL